jgi:hypothetical protein
MIRKDQGLFMFGYSMNMLTTANATPFQPCQLPATITRVAPYEVVFKQF